MSKKDLSPNEHCKKLKENSNNNKYNNTDIKNNLKCINVNEVDTDDNNLTTIESIGDREYNLCLKNALKEALDENEKVRNFFLLFLDERANY